MGKALIIGAGGVASVVVHKCCQNSQVFEEICIASRTKSKCDALKAKLDGGKTKISTACVDADNTEMLIELIRSYHPDIVINVALPYQDLTIMDACLATGVWTRPIMSHRIPQNLNINGSGHIEKSLKKRESQHFLAVDLIRGLQVYSVLMP